MGDFLGSATQVMFAARFRDIVCKVQPKSRGTGQNAMKSYSNPGTYTVTLTVTGPEGRNQASKVISLTLPLFANITNTGSDQALIDKPWNATSFSTPYYQYGVEFTASCKTFTLFLGDTSGSYHTYDMLAPLRAYPNNLARHYK